MIETKFKDFLKEQMNDPDFRKEYEALEFEDAIAQSLVYARKSSRLTQKQLSKKTGVTQPDISKIENGNANPSLRTLQQFGTGFGMKMKLEILPMRTENAAKLYRRISLVLATFWQQKIGKTGEIV